MRINKTSRFCFRLLMKKSYSMDGTLYTPRPQTTPNHSDSFLGEDDESNLADFDEDIFENDYTKPV